MENGERRIRSLKLSGQDNNQLLNVRYCLEEAFRTASLPGLPPNAKVLIRRLDLGIIHSNHSSIQLAHTISEKVHALAVGAVSIDHRPNNDASVVWFNDPLQPYLILLAKLLDGGVANEWYWSSLFPYQKLRLNEVTITKLFIDSCQTPVKAFGVVLLIDSCLGSPRLGKLLSFVTPELAQRILYEQGMSPAVVSSTSLQHQSEYDPDLTEKDRSLFIRMPNLSTPWRLAIKNAVQLWGENDVRSKWLGFQALVFHRPAYLECKDTLQRISIINWLEAWSQDDEPIKSNVNKPIANELFDCVNDADDLVLRTDKITVNNAEINWLEAWSQDDEPIKTNVNKPIANELFDCVNDADDLVLRTDKITVNNEHAIENNLTNPPVSLEDQNIVELDIKEQLCFSNHAGFAFVIPLLQRLDITEMLARNEELLEHDYPRQLLWSMVQRFRLAESDPVWQLFENYEPNDNIVIGQFYPPEYWQQLVTQSGRPLIAYADKTKAYRSIQLDELIKITQLIANLYLRHFCEMSLRELLHQSGYVLITPTHWDVQFDINQTDLRLRRFALDSDPGWVPWLGKVVKFYFESKEN